VSMCFIAAFGLSVALPAYIIVCYYDDRQMYY